MTKDNLPLKTKLAFGIGSTGEAATNWVFSGLVFFYYNQIIGLPGTLTGIGVFIAMMFDAISDPLVGSISDRFKSKYGRRHPFMFFAPIPTSIALICIFYPPDAMSTFGLFTWFLFSTIFFATQHHDVHSSSPCAWCRAIGRLHRKKQGHEF